MKIKHQPQRSCIACRQKMNKKELIRIIRTPEGKVLVDPTGKSNGRGAYVCQQEKCWERGVSQYALSKALKVSISADQIDRLKQDAFASVA